MTAAAVAASNISVSVAIDSGHAAIDFEHAALEFGHAAIDSGHKSGRHAWSQSGTTGRGPHVATHARQEWANSPCPSFAARSQLPVHAVDDCISQRPRHLLLRGAGASKPLPPTEAGAAGCSTGSPVSLAAADLASSLSLLVSGLPWTSNCPELPLPSFPFSTVGPSPPPGGRRRRASRRAAHDLQGQVRWEETALLRRRHCHLRLRARQCLDLGVSRRCR